MYNHPAGKGECRVRCRYLRTLFSILQFCQDINKAYKKAERELRKNAKATKKSAVDVLSKYKSVLSEKNSVLNKRIKSKQIAKKVRTGKKNSIGKRIGGVKFAKFLNSIINAGKYAASSHKKDMNDIFDLELKSYVSPISPVTKKSTSSPSKLLQEYYDDKKRR